MFRAEDDRLFPRRAALRVGEEMDLIEDDRVDRVHLPRRLNEHVPHDFRRHDEDRRARIDGHIAGEQADGLAVAVAQIAEFLIGERLDRRRVHHAATTPVRLVDGIFRDDRLPRSGRRGDHHRLAAPERGDGLLLKRIEREWIEGVERRTHVVTRVGSREFRWRIGRGFGLWWYYCQIGCTHHRHDGHSADASLPQSVTYTCSMTSYARICPIG